MTGFQEEALRLRAERRHKELNKTLWWLNTALWLAMISLYVWGEWRDSQVLIPMWGVSLVLGYAIFVSASALLGISFAFVPWKDWDYGKRFNRVFLVILTILQGLGMLTVIVWYGVSLFL